MTTTKRGWAVVVVTDGGEWQVACCRTRRQAEREATERTEQGRQYEAERCGGCEECQ